MSFHIIKDLQTDLSKMTKSVVEHKVFALFVGLVFMFILLVHLLPHTGDRFLESSTDSRLLENILRASYKPKYNGNSIFFIESNRKDDKVLGLSSRQACCIEAAGKTLYK